MNFKRPSFKRGGSTGIGQLTPRRQGYAGGGNIGGSRIGLFEGGIPTSMMEELTGGANKIKTTSSNPYRISGYPKKGFNMLQGPTRSTLQRLYSNPYVRGGAYGAAAGAGTGIGLLFDAYQKATKTPLAYKKLKEVSSRPYYFDETNLDFAEGLDEIKAANKIGEAPGFFPRGGKDKFYEDRNLDPETGLAIEDINIDMRGDPAQFTGEDEVTDFDAIVEKMVSNKKTDTETDDKPEPTFEDTYQTEFDRIQKLIGDDNTKGLTAIALSEAIGTPGTIADKAAVLNKSLVGIMGNKKKDKKEIAMLAYKATKEIEKAKIVAGKEGFSEKQFSRMMDLRRIVKDNTGTYNEEQKKNANAELSLLTETIDSLGAKNKTGLGSGFSQGLQAVQALDERANKIITYTGDKNSDKYKKMISEYNSALSYLAAANDPSINSGITQIQSRMQNALGKKDGGRIERALGSPETGEMGTMPMSQTVNNSETPTAQVSKLSFEELRDRLPPEVTDDVIRFLSQSEQALQDFAYIRTAGDIKKFNMKYGLNLVLPAQA